MYIINTASSVHNDHFMARQWSVKPHITVIGIQSDIKVDNAVVNKAAKAAYLAILALVYNRSTKIKLKHKFSFDSLNQEI